MKAYTEKELMKKWPMNEIPDNVREFAVAWGAPFHMGIRDTVKLARDILNVYEDMYPWISADKPPKESGRYWCYVEEINDLGKSYFQWNCYYDATENRWSDNLKSVMVTHWAFLKPPPQKH